MMASKDLLERVASEVQDDFQDNHRIMSFPQFMEAFAQHPRRHARSSAQYVRDCFEFFGRETKPQFWGEVTHFGLFNTPFDQGRNRLVGQERTQEQVFKLLENFVREGKVNKLILLHGPNGSAKSTFVDTVMRAMEHYSHTEEGALYRFNWIFPTEKLARGSSIGFGGYQTRTVDASTLESFAFLDEEDIDAKISSDLKDHPLLLIPLKQRQVLLQEFVDEWIIPSDSNDSDALRERLDGDGDEEGEAPFTFSDTILRGDLSHTNRQIFDALLTAYRGDFGRVMKHVQVERFYISRRYRAGAVTVEPQMRVDAGLRQLTVDRSLSALPASLQNQTIFEPFGDLVDANRGIIEYDDLFKRHPDFNKYLLATSEKATVSLENRILHLDTVMMATANEDYLDAYKQTADYSSFKGRVELVRVPYLLDYTVEEIIYREQIASVNFTKRIAPHTTFVAALWAVLTRLKRPQADQYSATIRDIVGRLSPLEKADLYAHGRVPSNIGPERARELKAIVPRLMAEGEGSADYEGRYGASPREMKMILLNASQNERFPTLSPLAVFEEMGKLVRDPSVFPFLQMKPDGPYYRHDQFIDVVRERYLDIIDLEIRSAMGLVEEKQYGEFFTRYIDHVSQWLKGEKVYNRITGRYEKPDEELMAEMEETINHEEDPEDFRRGLITSIAAFSIDNPGMKVDYQQVFPMFFEALQEAFFEERQRQIQRIEENLLTYFESEDGALSSSERQSVETTLTNLKSRYGYCDESAREAVAFLLSNRYKS
ncbi:serine protein kinase PrkA [Bradymonadaceae bacterium TMQ3]|nr:serine protein kinase PrkA [Bradymonadaceae bacterium TMQ3]TXC78133.1 serine protein kinase PrkA [Bradymonadales bacterium TMQ1]